MTHLAVVFLCKCQSVNCFIKVQLREDDSPEKSLLLIQGEITRHSPATLCTHWGGHTDNGEGRPIKDNYRAIFKWSPSGEEWSGGEGASKSPTPTAVPLAHFLYMKMSPFLTFRDQLLHGIAHTHTHTCARACTHVNTRLDHPLYFGIDKFVRACRVIIDTWLVNTAHARSRMHAHTRTHQAR